jgi:hypothetical protein
MTKGRAVFPGRVVAEQEPFYITLDEPKAHDSSVEKHSTRQPQNRRSLLGMFFDSAGVTALRLEGMPQRCGPFGYFGFACIPLFPSRQLNGKVADGSALHVTTMNFEPRGLLG